MKKILILIVAFVSLVSCNSSDEPQIDGDKVTDYTLYVATPLSGGKVILEHPIIEDLSLWAIFSKPYQILSFEEFDEEYSKFSAEIIDKRLHTGLLKLYPEWFETDDAIIKGSIDGIVAEVRGDRRSLLELSVSKSDVERKFYIKYSGVNPIVPEENEIGEIIDYIPVFSFDIVVIQTDDIAPYVKLFKGGRDPYATYVNYKNIEY